MTRDCDFLVIGSGIAGLSPALRVAELIVQCAIARKQSRGLHYTVDHPEHRTEAKDTLLPRSPVAPSLAEES